MSNKKTKRGIDDLFAEKFRNSPSPLLSLLSLYENEANRKDLFLGVRNRGINLYYRGASLCEVRLRKGTLKCRIHRKYLKGSYDKEYPTRIPEEIYKEYENIKRKIVELDTTKRRPERIAQQELIYKNNSNPHSKWYCIDIEYSKGRKSKAEEKYGRFDIIAITRRKDPQNGKHRVALIELKHGSGAYGGASGVAKHVDDFVNFRSHHVYEMHLRGEICDILESFHKLLKDWPEGLKNLKEDDLAEAPEFYFITLDNNSKSKTSRGSTPRQSMERYLFKNPKCGHPSTKNVEQGFDDQPPYGDITSEGNSNLYAKFLFSTDKVGEIHIKDIIEDESYVRGF